LVRYFRAALKAEIAGSNPAGDCLALDNDRSPAYALDRRTRQEEDQLVRDLACVMKGLSMPRRKPTSNVGAALTQFNAVQHGLTSGAIV